MLDENVLRDFVCEMTLRGRSEIGPATPLLSSGVIDSLNLLQLISFVEKESGIKIRPRDMALKHFDSITRILAFLKTQSS